MSKAGNGSEDGIFSNGARDKTGGAWCARIVHASAARVVAKEATSKVGSHAVGDGAGDGTFGDGAGYRIGGAWGSRIVCVSGAKAGAKEVTRKVGYHKLRVDWACWYGYDVMSVSRGILHGSCIRQSAACLFRSPWTAAYPSLRGTVG